MHVIQDEGFINAGGGNTWYKIIGTKKGIPLIVIHGGPGYPHDSLNPLSALTTDRRVIFYDQLGCGNSEKTQSKDHWTVEYFVKELHFLIKKLRIDKYHILGHSWGSALGAAFALSGPSGLKSIILSSPYLSTPHWEKDAQRLLKKLPQKLQEVLKNGDLNSEEYEEASREYYERHVWGMEMDKLPVGNLKSRYKMNFEIYKYMWGSSEFKVGGTLKSFDLSARLCEINIPVLFLCGRNDEATPESTLEFQSNTPNSKIVIFENSSHNPQYTQAGKYLEAVRNFLKAND